MSGASLGPVFGAAPDVIAFDGLETLFSLSALGLTGDWRTFHEVAKATLGCVLPNAPDSALEHVLSGLIELDPYPDSGPAMGRAVQGARVIVLTNGSGPATCKLLERARLDAFVEAVVSADDAGAWKPAADAYLHAAEVAGVPPERLALVSVHPWDIHGARATGLLTGWCDRTGSRFPETFHEADVQGPDLLEVVEAFLAFTP